MTQWPSNETFTARIIHYVLRAAWRSIARSRSPREKVELVFSIRRVKSLCAEARSTDCSLSLTLLNPIDSFHITRRTIVALRCILSCERMENDVWHRWKTLRVLVLNSRWPLRLHCRDRRKRSDPKLRACRGLSEAKAWNSAGIFLTSNRSITDPHHSRIRHYSIDISYRRFAPRENPRCLREGVFILELTVTWETRGRRQLTLISAIKRG